MPEDYQVPDLKESLTQTSADLTSVAKRKINEELANNISNIELQTLNRVHSKVRNAQSKIAR